MTADKVAERNTVLIRDLVAGNQAARDEMIMINRPLVLMTVERLLQTYPNCRHAKADLFGIGIIALIQAIDHLAKIIDLDRPIRPIRNYLITAVRSKITTEINRQRAYYCTHQHVPTYDCLPEAALVAENCALENVDLADVLYNLCADEEEREIIRLYLENTSQPDIIAATGWSRRSLCKFFQKIRREIQKEWRD